MQFGPLEVKYHMSELQILKELEINIFKSILSFYK